MSTKIYTIDLPIMLTRQTYEQLCILYPPIQVTPDTPINEIMFDAGRQSVLDMLKRYVRDTNDMKLMDNYKKSDLSEKEVHDIEYNISNTTSVSNNILSRIKRMIGYN